MKLDNSDLPRLVASLKKDGYRVFLLDAGLADTESVFASIKRNCPLDPPLVRDDNWDALEDSLWTGLFDCDAQKIAIVIPELALEQGVELPLSSVMTALSETLSDPRFTMGRPKELRVFGL